MGRIGVSAWSFRGPFFAVLCAFTASCMFFTSFDEYVTSSVVTVFEEASTPSHSVPELTAPPPVKMAQGQTVKVEVALRAPDDEEATVTTTDLPPGLVVTPGALVLSKANPSGSFQWTAARDAPTGSFTIGIVASRANSAVRSRVDVATLLVGRSGSLDTSFGKGGIVTLDSVAFNDKTAISVRADGPILFASNGPASTASCFWTQRASDGSLDPSLAPGNPTLIDSCVIKGGGFAADGRVMLVTASPTDGAFALRRETADGKSDPTFGTSGLVNVPFSFGPPGQQGVLLGSKGAMTVLGNDGAQGLAVRYDAAGKLDGSFGAGGTLTWPSPRYPYAVVEQPGNILVVGDEDKSTPTAARLTRLLPNGEPDLTFGTQGGVALRDGPFPQLAVQPDGALIVLRRTPNAANPYQLIYVLERHDASGREDLSFRAGVVPAEITWASGAAISLAVGNGGEILLAGIRQSRMTVARYRANGELDVGFADQGLAEGPPAASVEAFAVQLDGKIVLAGRSPVGSVATVARLWP